MDMINVCGSNICSTCGAIIQSGTEVNRVKIKNFTDPVPNYSLKPSRRKNNRQEKR